MLPSKWQPNNSVFWDEKSPCLALRTDISSSRVIVFSDNPIPSVESLASFQSNGESTAAIYYFEIEILSNVNDGGSSEIAIGIAPVDSTHQHDQMHMDTYNSFRSAIGSVSYSNTGVVTRAGSANPVIRYGSHDVIGCGCEIGGGSEIFFTCNGKIITEPNIDKGPCCNSVEKNYFPAVELLGIGTTIR